MKFQVRALLLVLLSALALGGSAVKAAPAAATESHFLLEVDHVFLSGGQTEGKIELVSHVLLGEATLEYSISCNVATFHSTAESLTTTLTELTFLPTFTGCKNSLGGSATVTDNGCHVRPATGDPEKHQPVFLVCPPGKSLEVHDDPPFSLGTCKYVMAPQWPSGGLTYTSIGSGPTREVVADVTAVVHVVKSETGINGCFGQVGTNFKDVELRGQVVIEGQDTEGNQVGIEVS